MFENVVKPMFLTTLVPVVFVVVSAWEKVFKPWVLHIFENNVAKTNGSTTFTKPMLLKLLISATLFLEMSVKSFSNCFLKQL